MHYPIVIDPGGAASSFGVVVPDLPGCFSAGDTLAEALANVTEAVEAWVDAMLDAGGVVPEPSSPDDIWGRPEYRGWVFAVVTVDPARLDDRVERVNISVPRRILARIDAIARARGLSRSAAIAELAIHAPDARH